jgi:hypothetical protein
MRDDAVRNEGNAVLCTSIEEERNMWLQYLLGFRETGLSISAGLMLSNHLLLQRGKLEELTSKGEFMRLLMAELFGAPRSSWLLYRLC